MDFASEECWRLERRGLPQGGLILPSPEFALYGPRTSGRDELQRYVAASFRAAHGADVRQFLPFFLAMRCLGGLSGVAGMRPAATAPLFLEQYLTAPAETLLAARVGHAVTRRGLVEVGNLAAARRGASQLLFVVTAALLHRAGFEWMVFTATRSLANSLLKLDYPTLALAPADPARLSAEEKARWGSYYDSGPEVRAGRLSDAARVIRERPLFRQAMRVFEHPLAQLSEQLRREAGNAP